MNVAAGDAAAIELTLPHLHHLFGRDIATMLVVVDPRPPSGRIAAQHLEPPSMEALNDALSRVAGTGVPLRRVDVDYGRASRRAVSRRYFGGARSGLRCAGGTPIYAFLFGLHQAQTRYVIHLDSDLVFFGGEESWIRVAIDVLAENKDIYFVNPYLGPPRQDGTPHDIIGGVDASTGLRLSSRFSTRCFCYDQIKADIGFFPMKRSRYPLSRWPLYLARGRELDVALETSVARTLCTRKVWRCDLEPRYGWVIHVADKDAFGRPEIREVIRAVEQGTVPAAQRGQANLQIPFDTRYQ